MKIVRRRSVLELALAALPLPLVGQTSNMASTTAALRVAAGMDREGKKHAVGVSSTTYKVLTRDTGGAAGLSVICLEAIGRPVDLHVGGTSIRILLH